MTFLWDRHAAEEVEAHFLLFYSGLCPSWVLRAAKGIATCSGGRR